MKDSSRGVPELVRRIRGEFMEMPGLRLTVEQARRLWRLDNTACDAVLFSARRRAFFWRLLPTVSSSVRKAALTNVISFRVGPLGPARLQQLTRNLSPELAHVVAAKFS
jgi:hypothetical protein